MEISSGINTRAKVFSLCLGIDRSAVDGDVAACAQSARVIAGRACCNPAAVDGDAAREYGVAVISAGVDVQRAAARRLAVEGQRGFVIAVITQTALISDVERAGAAADVHLAVVGEYDVIPALAHHDGIGIVQRPVGHVPARREAGLAAGEQGVGRDRIRRDGLLHAVRVDVVHGNLRKRRRHGDGIRGHGEGIGVVVGNLVLFLRAVHLQRCQFIARVGLDGQGDGVVLRGIVYAGLGRHAAVFAGLDDDVRRGEGDVREVICVAGDVAGIIHLARRVVQVLAGLDGDGLVFPGIHIIAVGFDAVGGIRPAEGDVAVGRVEALTVFAGRGHVAAGDADVADAADGIGLTCADGVHRTAADSKAILAADAISVLPRCGGVHRTARDRDGRLSSAYRKGDNAIAAPGRDAAPGDGNG